MDGSNFNFVLSKKPLPKTHKKELWVNVFYFSNSWISAKNKTLEYTVFQFVLSEFLDAKLFFPVVFCSLPLGPSWPLLSRLCVSRHAHRHCAFCASSIPYTIPELSEKSSKSRLFKKFPLEKQSRSPLRPAIEKRLNERTRAFFNLSIKFSADLRLRQIEQTFVVFLGSVGY